MKKIALILSIAVVMSGLLSSCGSGNANLKGEELVEMTKSQRMAQEKPFTRGWGEFTHPNLTQAKKYAAANARDDLANSLYAELYSLLRLADETWITTSSDKKRTGQVSESTVMGQSDIQNLAQGAVRGAYIINTDTYQLKNGQYHVFVCLELRATPEELADEFTDRVEQLIPEGRKREFRESLQRFHDEVERNFR